MGGKGEGKVRVVVIVGQYSCFIPMTFLVSETSFLI